MAKAEFESQSFRNTDDQETLVSEWQGRYYTLVGRLAHVATEVVSRRVVEHDQDIQPYTFVRGAFHEFIYPPQTVTLASDESGVVDPTAEYALQQIYRTYAYDAGQVEGRIEVAYYDSNGQVLFTVRTNFIDELQNPARGIIEQAIPDPAVVN